MNIVLICGKQGAGKTTLARNLMVKLNNVGFKCEHMKFAVILYEMHDAIRGILRKYGIDKAVDGQDFQGIDGPLLQVLGNEWGRKTRGEDFWVNVMKARVDKSDADWIIIDDCRLENEFYAFDGPDLEPLPEYKVFKIRLTAPEDVRKVRAEKWRENTTHASETGLDRIRDEDFFMRVNTANYSKEETLALVFYYIVNYERVSCKRF